MRMLLNVLLSVSILTGCSQNQANKATHSSIMPSLPSPPVIVWENVGYVVESETIPKEMIGKEIGEVKRYVDPYKSMPVKDEDSTVAPVGSKLFEIKGVSVRKAFAVQFNGEYRKVQRDEP